MNEPRGAAAGRYVWAIGGLSLLCVGVFMPTGWYERLPPSPFTRTRPEVGTLFLQACLVIEGLVLLAIAVTGVRFVPLPPRERLAQRPAFGDSTTGRQLGLVALITVLGLALRAFHLDADLWIDEISTVHDFGPRSVPDLVFTYHNLNNHLLNTLLVKLAGAMLGVHEWSVRLPAVLFGVATIPLVYWVSRSILPRIAALGASLLLAVSYHHIFFSQNARGYSAYLFFSIAASGLLLTALREDRLALWGLFVAATVLNFAAHFNAVFVLAAHVLVAVAVIADVGRRDGLPWRLIRRCATVFGVATLLAFHLYATVLPQAYVVMRSVKARAGEGFNPFSVRFVNEVIRGIGAGFGPGLLIAALPFLALAAFGFFRLLRRDWALVSALTLPVVITALWLLIDGQPLTPRFFLLGLVVAILAVVTTIQEAAGWIATVRYPRALPGIVAGSVSVLAMVSLSSLRSYYTIPKQPYRASLAYLESLRKPDDIVIVIDLASVGFRYYAGREGGVEGPVWYFVGDPQRLDALVATHPGQRTFLLTTFRDALRLRSPDLDRRVRQGWVPARTFPATVGDGEITVWTMRP